MMLMMEQLPLRHDVLAAALPTNVHACSCKRTRRWADLWSFLASQEEADAEHIADVPVPQIHEELVDSAQIIPQKISWSRPSNSQSLLVKLDTASTAVANAVGEAQPLGFAKCNASTELELAKSPGDTGSDQCRHSNQLESLWVKPGPLCPRSTVPRQNPNSQSRLVKVKLGLLGPEQMARPVPPFQQSMPMKLGLLGLRSAVL